MVVGSGMWGPACAVPRGTAACREMHAHIMHLSISRAARLTLLAAVSIRGALGAKGQAGLLPRGCGCISAHCCAGTECADGPAASWQACTAGGQ